MPSASHLPSILWGLLWGTVFACALPAQNLLPSIGIASLPPDTAALCQAPWYLGNYELSGLQEGDTASDFTLYDLNGNPFNLRSALQTGKPVLLVAGSYTCPVFRGKIPVINDIVANYGGDLTTVVIYELEAHPHVDTSAYFGYVNPGSQNINAGILYRQPTTYGERKAIAGDMLDSLPIAATVLMDGPCHEFWSWYGPAPNNAYLIDTSGIVVAKHAWFHKYPEDIYCDLDSLLGNPSSCAAPANGTFGWRLDGPNIVYGPAGQTLAAHGWLVNRSSSDALILMTKYQQILPAGWSSSICTDICYPSSSDSATLLLPAGDSLWYTMYFYTGLIPDTGRVQMRFRNLNVPGNNFSQWFGGITSLSTAVAAPELQAIRVWPQPARERVRFRLPLEMRGPGITLRVYDLQRRSRGTWRVPESGDLEIGRESFSAGLYGYRVEAAGRPLWQGKLLWMD